MEGTDKLSRDRIQQLTKAERFGADIVVLPLVDSTNRYAKELATHGAPEGMVVLTEWQLGGHGRHGRSWQASPRNDIAISLILRPKRLPQQTGDLALIASVAVRRAIATQTGLTAAIKWPNDLVLNGKKCCGILGEMATSGETIAHLVLGIGLNVNTLEFDGDLAQTATSLRLESGTVWDRNEIAAQLLTELERAIDGAWLGKCRADIFEDYRAHSLVLGQNVTLIDGEGTHGGIAEDIADDGGLILRLRDGRMRHFVAGDASLRLD